ncbi:hypothetical protein B0H14DRAFT_3471624 [Mycena olivaceomarginata]|nr:hypothetical protein B0H14DRAFT_3471624 [Mycena olivaceomarginata]
MHDGKYVLLFAVVPAITRAATSDNTGAADSPYNLILETKSRRPRSQVSGTQQALRKTCTNDTRSSRRNEPPPRPALLEQARIDLRNIGMLRGGSKRTATRVVASRLNVGMWFLYMVLGWLIWVGVASIILLVPVAGYIARLVQFVQRERLKRMDDGAQPSVKPIKVKVFGWEETMKDRIADKREHELNWTRKGGLLDLASNLVNFSIPIVTMTVTYATCVSEFL